MKVKLLVEKFETVKVKFNDDDNHRCKIMQALLVLLANEERMADFKQVLYYRHNATPFFCHDCFSC